MRQLTVLVMAFEFFSFYFELILVFLLYLVYIIHFFFNFWQNHMLVPHSPPPKVIPGSIPETHAIFLHYFAFIPFSKPGTITNNNVR